MSALLGKHRSAIAAPVFIALAIYSVSGLVLALRHDSTVCRSLRQYRYYSPPFSFIREENQLFVASQTTSAGSAEYCGTDTSDHCLLGHLFQNTRSDKGVAFTRIDFRLCRTLQS